jgi:hypothetical protein
VFKGRDAEARHVLELHLRDTDRDNLMDAVRREIDDAAKPLCADADTMILSTIGEQALRTCLPRDTLRRLERFTVERPAVLRVCNLPVQDFPPTPVRGFADESELAVTNALHLGLIRRLGLTPFAVDYENGGKLMRNVVPNPDAADEASSWGSNFEFFWHNDNPQLGFGHVGADPRAFVPGFLTFFAARNDEKVATEVLVVDDVVRTLPKRVREVLCRPLFDVAPPESNDGGVGGEPMTAFGVPLLERTTRGYRSRFDDGTTEGRTPEAKQALAEWVAALKRSDAALAPVLEPGDFLAFDNTTVVHKRRGFTPATDGRERWLRRCYASR